VVVEVSVFLMRSEVGGRRQLCFFERERENHTTAFRAQHTKPLHIISRSSLMENRAREHFHHSRIMRSMEEKATLLKGFKYTLLNRSTAE
jgi:hypothetical protein